MTTQIEKAVQIFEILKTGKNEMFIRIPTGHAITAQDLLQAIVSCKGYLIDNGIEESIINNFILGNHADALGRVQ